MSIQITTRAVSTVFDRLKEHGAKKIQLRICTNRYPNSFYINCFADGNSYSIEDDLAPFREMCEVCGRNSVDASYSYIIEKLKEKSLLDKNYRKRCCMCYDKACI